MSWVDDALADYGRSLGLPSLEFNESGTASLQFDVLGELYIEQVEGSILLYVAREYQRLDTRVMADAMSACHWDGNPAFPANVALHADNNLVFSVTLPETEFDVPNMERAIDYLGSLHDSVREGTNT